MKSRPDSLFAKLTEDQRDYLVLLFESDHKLNDLVDMVAKWPTPIKCSIAAMGRLIKQAQADKRLRDAEESAEAVEAFAKRGENRQVREATLAALRDRMFGASIETNNRELFMEVFNALNNERSKDKELEIEERKIRVAEENAKIGWRKMEIESARSGLKLLPKIRDLLSDTTKAAEDRISAALACLAVEGAALLTQSATPALPEHST